MILTWLQTPETGFLALRPISMGKVFKNVSFIESVYFTQKSDSLIM